MSTKIVTDGLGNELHEGDMVMIQLEQPFVVGRIVKLTHGGISLATPAGKNTQTVGQMQILCPQQIVFRAGTAIRHIVRVVDPEATAHAEELVGDVVDRMKEENQQEQVQSKNGPIIVP